MGNKIFWIFCQLFLIVGAQKSFREEDLYCRFDQPLLLSRIQQGKDCSAFSSNQCLCALHGNCEYNEESKICLNTTDCNEFHNNGVLCRHNHCSYECGSRMCEKQNGGQPECEIASGGCAAYCDDICICKQNECTYNLDGSCKNFATAGCTIDSFKVKDCARKDAFYVNKGEICRNEKSGLCDIEKTILAVNVAGEGFIDSRGVTYKPGNLENAQDPHKLQSVVEVDNYTCRTEDCEILHKQIVLGNSSKRENGKCIYYNVPICEDGFYELIVNTMEVSNVLPGEKTFNIKLNGIYVIPEVDIMSLAGKTFFPVELIVVFEINSNVLIVNGHKPSVIQNSVLLEFCYGECGFMQGTFAVAAFAITKLALYKPMEVMKKHCNQFDGVHWYCIKAGCHYNTSSKACTEKSKTCQNTCNCQLNVKCKCSEHVFQFYFIFHYDKHAIPEFQSRIDKIILQLKKHFPNSRFGFGLGYQYYTYFCYSEKYPLTSDYNAVITNTSATKIPFEVEYFERIRIFNPILLAAQRKTVGWNEQDCEMNFIIIFAAKDINVEIGRWDVLKGDGTDTCELADKWPPTWSFLEKLMDRQNMALFFVLGFNASLPAFEKQLHQSNLRRGFAKFEDSATAISRQILTFADSAFVEYNNTKNCPPICSSFVNRDN